jgi:hypothetical protein
MNKLALLFCAALFAGCATSPPSKPKPAEIPKAMLPNNGMTESKAGGFGKASKFLK